MKASKLLCILLAGLVLGMFAILPAPAQAAPLAHPPIFAGSLITPPPQILCPGDQASIMVMILDTAHGIPAAGYPVNILQSNPGLGSLEPISKVVTNGIVSFVYKSNDNSLGKGVQTDVLTFNAGGFPTNLHVPITVTDCGDYQFDFLLEHRKTQDFITLYTYVSGKGTATRINGQLTGVETGESKAFFSIGGESNGMVCKLEPSIQGNSNFNVDGVIQPQAPNFDLLSVSFTFDQMSFNSGELYCAIIDMRAAYPFEVGSWDPDELGLQGLSVPLYNNRGTIPISVQAMTGQLTVRREVTK